MWNRRNSWLKLSFVLAAGVILGAGGGAMFRLAFCQPAQSSDATGAEHDAQVLRELGVSRGSIDYRTMSEDYRHALQLFYSIEAGRGGFRTGHWDEPIDVDLLARYRRTGNIGLLVAERIAGGTIDNGHLTACALDILAEIGDEKSLAVLRNMRGWGPRAEAQIADAVKRIESRLNATPGNTGG